MDDLMHTLTKSKTGIDNDLVILYLNISTRVVKGTIYMWQTTIHIHLSFLLLLQLPVLLLPSSTSMKGEQLHAVSKESFKRHRY